MARIFKLHRTGIMDKPLIQCNIFTAMLVNGNRHFLSEACRLLKRAAARTYAEKVAYNKLLHWVQKTDIESVDQYIRLYNIQYFDL